MKKVHTPIQLKQVKEYINTVFPTLTDEYLSSITARQLDEAWRNWLTQTKYNTVNGLDEFKFSAFSAGTTPAFGEFISRYPDRRIRVSRSDFILTKILSKTYNRTVSHLEDYGGALFTKDCLIISYPFSGNGSLYPNIEFILDQADDMDIPVFIDGAYFGISHGIKYPLYRKCVKDFAVSLSKNLAGNSLRLGIRFTKENVDDTLTAPIISGDIFDKLGAAITIKLLEKYPHEWLIDLLKPQSDIVCALHGLTPTNTVTVALGGEKHTKEYTRGDYTRVIISDELSQ
jgi:hypothetical protein